MFRLQVTIIRQAFQYMGMTCSVLTLLFTFAVVLVKPKHVGPFIVNLNVNFNILKQLNYALVGQIKDLITKKSFSQNTTIYSII